MSSSSSASFGSSSSSASTKTQRWFQVFNLHLRILAVGSVPFHIIEQLKTTEEIDIILELLTINSMTLRDLGDALQAFRLWTADRDDIQFVDNGHQRFYENIYIQMEDCDTKDCYLCLKERSCE